MRPQSATEQVRLILHALRRRKRRFGPVGSIRAPEELCSFAGIEASENINPLSIGNSRLKIESEC